uniref:Putative cytochrome c oxidase subunit viia n=1 Tax=Panstrongylus megistus TaxID=65343 RepID=A0A069DNU0_9HEMI
MSLLRSALTPLARNSRSFVSSPASRSATDQVPSGYKQLQHKADKFNIADGKPVFVKGGTLDSILYKLTMGACVGAVIWDLVLYYELAQR